jgi:hypothetical protein
MRTPSAGGSMGSDSPRQPTLYTGDVTGFKLSRNVADCRLQTAGYRPENEGAAFSRAETSKLFARPVAGSR